MWVVKVSLNVLRNKKTISTRSQSDAFSEKLHFVTLEFRCNTVTQRLQT